MMDTNSTARPDGRLTIVLGPEVDEPVVFAAEELGRYIRDATGMEVRHQREAGLKNSRGILLTLQYDPADEALRFPESRNEEAYRIYGLTGGGRGFTGHSPRAVLYGVYAFLEQDLGYRWYFPYPEDNLQPQMPPETFMARLNEAVDHESAPAYSFRQREFRDVAPTTEHTEERIVQQIDWWAKMRMNCFLINFNYARNPEQWTPWKERYIPEIQRRGMSVGLGEHGSYVQFLAPERYAAEHPDWYCEIDGKRVGSMMLESGEQAQFCTTNSEALATYLENFAEFVRAHPQVDFYYPAPNDGGRWCECAQCRDLSIADRYLMLNNQIAETLNKVKPGTHVMHLAYSNHRLPPEKTVPHPMIDVDVATWGRNFNYRLNDPRTKLDEPDYLDVFKQWAAICRPKGEKQNGRLLYHYKIMRHYWLGIHLFPLPIIDEDFEDIAEIGMDGFDLPLGFLGIWTKALNTYVVAQKAWDPSESAVRLTERFMTEFYGEQVEAAKAIYQHVGDAFGERLYGGWRLLAWFPETSKVTETPLEGLSESARHAIDCLNKALALTEKTVQDATAPVADRLKKLHAVIRHARDEQLVLEQLDGLMHAYHALRQNDSGEARQRALEAWEATRAENEVLAANYSLEEDKAGLYWSSASHRQIEEALGKWRDAIGG